MNTYNKYIYLIFILLVVYVINTIISYKSCRSLKALWGYMKRININHIHVWETIKDLVVKAIIA